MKNKRVHLHIKWIEGNYKDLRVVLSALSLFAMNIFPFNNLITLNNCYLKHPKIFL